MSRNILSTKILSTFLLCIFLFSIIAPTQAHAGVFGNIQDDIKGKLEQGFEDGSISCVAAAAVAALFSYIASAVTNVPTTDVPTVLKDQIMDCVFWVIKNKIIDEITKNTVGYIQTGMDGNPAFVQNIQRHLLTIADETAGAYIEKTALGEFLCSPYRAEIQKALTRYYQEQTGRGPNGAGATSCTLSDMVTNLDSFVSGDFSAGGWDAWVTMYINPYNNPYGAYAETQKELNRRVANATQEAEKKLNQGDGYLGKETQDCFATVNGTPVPITEDQIGSYPGAEDYFCDAPKTVTPGTTVKNALEQTFGVTMAELANADELSEIITLWLTHMLEDILIGDEGLAGYNPDDFEHEVPESEISDVDWDDIDIGPGQGGGQCTPMDISDGVPGRGGQLVNEPEPFTSTASDPFKEITIDVPPGQNYSRVTAEFDLTTAPQTAPANASQLNLFWLHRGPNIAQSEWAANDIAEVVLNAENGRVRFATSVNSCEMVERAERSPFRDNLTYHVIVDYNPGAGTMSVKVDGSTLVSLNTTVNILQSGDQRGRGGFFIKLGNAENVSADEGLADGFTWSNLRVNFTPGEATTGGGDDDDDTGGDDDDSVARIFIDDRDTPNKNELYSESSSGVTTKISQTLGAEGDVFRFERTPDGARVVYSADVQNDRAELFVVPSTGGTVTKISSPTTVFSDGTSSDVIRFSISPDGQRVAYAADPNEWTKYELYSVPITGGTVTRLSHQLPFDYDVDDFKFTPDSQRTLYRAGRTSIGLWELFSTPSNRAGSIKISQTMDPGENVPQNGFEVSCNSQTTYFLADLIGGALPILYSVPTNGGVITEVGGGQLPGNICS